MVRREFIVHPTRADLPFSSAVRAGDFIFVSGTTGTVDAQGNPTKGIEAQTTQCLENISQVLQTAGAALSDINSHLDNGLKYTRGVIAFGWATILAYVTIVGCSSH